MFNKKRIILESFFLMCYIEIENNIIYKIVEKEDNFMFGDNIFIFKFSENIIDFYWSNDKSDSRFSGKYYFDQISEFKFKLICDKQILINQGREFKFPKTNIRIEISENNTYINYP